MSASALAVEVEGVAIDPDYVRAAAALFETKLAAYIEPLDSDYAEAAVATAFPKNRRLVVAAIHSSMRTTIS